MKAQDTRRTTANKAFNTKHNKELRYVIGRGLALTRKQMLSPTDQRGTRRHAVADSQRADNYADAHQESRKAGIPIIIPALLVA